MGEKRISMISGAALLVLTAAASATPLNVTSSKAVVLPQTQIELTAYRHKHNYSHCGWSWHKGRLYYAGRLYEGPPIEGTGMEFMRMAAAAVPAEGVNKSLRSRQWENC